MTFDGSTRPWLEDLAHLSGPYATLSFDITRDGKRIVFDRVNDSDIVFDRHTKVGVQQGLAPEKRGFRKLLKNA